MGSSLFGSPVLRRVVTLWSCQSSHSENPLTLWACSVIFFFSGYSQLNKVGPNTDP